MDVQTVTSPGGIEAWLVEDYTVPMFALRFAFKGGASQDPVGKEGLTNFVALMLEQGAGDFTTAEFEQQIHDLAIRVGFRPEFDAVTGSIEALNEMRNAAAQLVSLVLTRPRFDAETIERVRRHLLSFHGDEARAPLAVAEAQWNAVAFAGHPYARKVYGSEASVNEITADDLRTYHKCVFAKERLKVVAAGDITVDELGELLDRLFGDLPASADLVEIPKVSPVAGGRLRVAEMDVPQSIVTFGVGAVPYGSADYIPAYVLSHIVGGHGISSRLVGELRRKRGLVFSAVTWLHRRQHAAVFRGRMATRNDMVGKALDVLRQEMQKMADGDLSQAELDDAKSCLIGSYPLAFGSNSKIATQLLGHAMDGFGPGFLENRKDLIAAVTLEDLKGVAKHMLNPENLIISIVGTPALQPPRTT
jgi:zinc protease